MSDGINKGKDIDRREIKDGRLYIDGKDYGRILTTEELGYKVSEAAILGSPLEIHPKQGESIRDYMHRIANNGTLKAKESVFDEAKRIIGGARQADYGPPERCNGNIADQWNMYILQKYNIITNLTFEDVCWMMSDLKKVRQMTKNKRDNIVDAVGYIGMIDETNKENKDEPA